VPNPAVTEGVVDRPARAAGDPTFRSMVEFAPAYFYQASAHAPETLYMSPQVEVILGYGVEEWTADPELWIKVIHPEDRDRVVAEFAAGVSGKKPFRSQYRIATKHGDYRWVRDHAALVPNPSGQGMIVQGVVLDITDQVGAEQGAMRAELQREAMSRFLGAMSHEFRTPLNSIIGFADLLTLAGFDPLTERQRRYILNISNSGNHLLGLVNELLDLTKVQAGQVELRMAAVELEVAVARAVDAVRPLAAGKGLSVDNQVTDRVLVMADPSRLHQVLLNLLSNSIKFTAVGFVGVVMSVTGDWVSVSVTDSGIGIVESDLDRVFEEFVQVGADHPNAQLGTGLGLPLARHLVHAMGGTIIATSTPGVGSNFTVRLQRA
jgi:two-component system sensor histidine kinase/response regulator